MFIDKRCQEQGKKWAVEFWLQLVAVLGGVGKERCNVGCMGDQPDPRCEMFGVHT